MKLDCLYTRYKKEWCNGGTVFLYSDPHFSDMQSYTFRGLYPNRSIEELDQMQINNINKVVGKKDTIIFLGDIGNPEGLKKIRGRKVLICGNHDAGISNYTRRIYEEMHTLLVDDTVDIDEAIIADFKSYATPDMSLIMNSNREDNQHKYKYSYNADTHVVCYFVKFDNKLVDEADIYPGILAIGPKLMLSHVNISQNFANMINIHGHEHAGESMVSNLLRLYDSDMPINQLFENQVDTAIKNNKNSLNVCAEWIGYVPVRLDYIAQSGILNTVKDILRTTTDFATARKQKHKTKDNQ